MFPLNIKRIEISRLVPHEQFRENHVSEILASFKRDGFQLRPIVIHRLGDGGLFLILDGHHRTEAARRLNLNYVMANIVDYFDPRIVVRSWGNEAELSKEDIIRIALNGMKVPPKSTKHVVTINGEEAPFQDNDFIEPEIYTSLRALK